MEGLWRLYWFSKSDGPGLGHEPRSRNFFSEEELENAGGLQQVSDFFDYLESLEAAFPLTQEIVEEQKELYQERRKVLKNLEDMTKSKRRKPLWEGPAFVDKKQSVEKRKQNFLKEWENGLTVLRDIASVVEAHKPEWLRPDIPASWQADQFLHAYYYNKVTGSGGHPYEKYYGENRVNPRAALKGHLVGGRPNRKLPQRRMLIFMTERLLSDHC